MKGPLRGHTLKPPVSIHLTRAHEEKAMSWMMTWGGVENKMSSRCHSQLPVGQGSLPPTV